MAGADSLRANYHMRTMVLVLGMLVLIQRGGAYEFKVGGSGDWGVPSGPDAASSYNQWAERSRFQIGDSILFNYPADKDSVLEVSKEDYNGCNTGSPIAKHSDGHTVFTFNHSGAHYFISGVEDNCKKNEKVVIVVMADRSNRTPSTPNSPPSPAPGGEGSPSPPSEMNPTPAPSTENPSPPPPPPPSGASSTVLSFLGSIGAFIGSSLLLVF